MTGARPTAELVKWYLDVACADGRCAVLYAARLRYRRLELRIQGLLLRSGGRVRTRFSLQPGPSPRTDGARLRFSSAGLDVSARLDALDPPFARRLLDAPGGAVDWECRVPRARADLRVGGETLVGLGYAERLRLTLLPGELPIRTLRWGRLLSPAGGIAWIDWEGPAPLRLALRDGREARLDRAGDDAVVVDGTPFALAREATLRDAILARTLPATLRRSLPRVGLGLHETKWLARGEVGAAPGLAIHEVVRWP